MHIHTLDYSLPHPDYPDWQSFLNTCSIRYSIKNVVFYNKTNCNYILFPNGTLIKNFGFHGDALMSDILNSSPNIVLNKLINLNNAINSLLYPPKSYSKITES